MIEHFFAPCPRGLEPALASELHELQAQDVHEVPGGVGFSGPYLLCYTVNLESRIASRVLWRVAEAAYQDEEEVYRTVRSLPWHHWFGVRRTLRVNVSAIRSPLKSLDFVTLRIKDAVCDAFRSAVGGRPDVDTRHPDVRIHAFLSVGKCTLYLDTSGEALFKRGYRAGGEAPLRENLAAGILRLIGWQGDTPLLDPMCGSGTFLTEAALIESGLAPGAGRRFGFEKLNRHDRDAWQEIRDRARKRPKRSGETLIYGSDRNPRALRLAHSALTALGLESRVLLKQNSVLSIKAPAPSGVFVTNPPYGVRMDERKQLEGFYPQLGDLLKREFSGWTAYILSADMALARGIRLSASRRTPLFNGALDCRLFEYRLVSGSNRKPSKRPAGARP